MPQRDYLMQQLEEMGYFLASLIRRILKLKEENQEQETTAVLHDSIQEQLSFSIDEAIFMENDAFLALMKEYFTSESNMEKMAELLMLTGKSIHSAVSPQKLGYLEKSLFLYEHLQGTSTSYSFERADKILEIKHLLIS